MINSLDPPLVEGECRKGMTTVFITSIAVCTLTLADGIGYLTITAKKNRTIGRLIFNFKHFKKR